MRPPINTGLWFAAWFVLIGYPLLSCSKQKDAVVLKTDPAAGAVAEKEGAHPVEAAAKKDGDVKVGGLREPPTEAAPVLERTPALKQLAWFLAESVFANARIDVQRDLVQQRRLEALKLLPVLAQANDQGRIKPGPSGDAWARLSGLDSGIGIKDSLPILSKFGTALASVGQGIVAGDPMDGLATALSSVSSAEEASRHITARMSNLMAAQRPMPKSLWLAALELRERFFVARDQLNAINRDIDTVLAALNEAGIPHLLPSDRVEQKDLRPDQIVLGTALRQRAIDPVTPPIPFPYEAVSDAEHTVVLKKRKFSDEENKQFEEAMKQEKRPPTLRGRIETYLLRRLDWAASTLTNPDDQPRVGMVLALGGKHYLYRNTWEPTNAEAVRMFMIEVASRRNGDGFTEADTLMDATNRLIYGIAKQFQPGAFAFASGTRGPAKELAEFLRRGFLEHRLPIRLSAGTGLFGEEIGRFSPGVVKLNAHLNEVERPGPVKDPAKDNFFQDEVRRLTKPDGSLDLEKLKKESEGRKK